MNIHFRANLRNDALAPVFRTLSSTHAANRVGLHIVPTPKALLHQIFLDFDDQWLYFVAPGGLLDKVDRASSSIVYALEGKSRLPPLSQLAPLSGAQQV